MIVLDTNVISELMRRLPDPRVMTWIADQQTAGLFTTTLTQAEIFYGLELLPDGRRRDDLLTAARAMFEIDLAGRVLPFDSDAALVYPQIAAGRKQGGNPSARSTPRSPPSSAHAAPDWRPAMCATLSSAGLRWLILGQRFEAEGSKRLSHRSLGPTKSLNGLAARFSGAGTPAVPTVRHYAPGILVAAKSGWLPISVSTLCRWWPISVTVKSGCLQDFSSAKLAKWPTAPRPVAPCGGPLRNGMKTAIMAAPLRLSKRRRHYRTAGGCEGLSGLLWADPSGNGRQGRVQSHGIANPDCSTLGRPCTV